MKSKYTQLLILIIALSSCSSGGGSGNKPVTPTPATPPAPTTSDPTFEELVSRYESYYEYERQWGLGLINASSAYARGFSGKGITIGITDSGLDVDHAEIDADRIDPGSYLSYDSYQPNTSQKRHGTMVASIAAGTLSRENDSLMHGVAWNADIFFVAIRLAEPDDDYEPVDLGDGDSSTTNPDLAESLKGTDEFFENIFQVFTSRDVDIINNSYGFSGNIVDYSEEIIRDAFPRTIQAIAQTSTPDADKTIFVWAAGNAGGYADQGVDFSSPEVFPGMTYFIEEIQGHSIAVVSVDEDGEISDFSSRCGVAKDFCIAAPGGSVIGAYPTSMDDTGIYDTADSCVLTNNCYAGIGGTSFASPFVAGAIAVMMEAFEGQLGSTEIVSRLFATANDEGIYSDAAIYGHGLLDLDAATNPVGSLSVNVTSNYFGEVAPLPITGLNAYHPMIVDALYNGLKNKTLIAKDELGSPFRVPMGSLLSSSSINPHRLDSFGMFASPKREVIFDDEVFVEYIHHSPYTNSYHQNSAINHLNSFSELNKTINFIDPANKRLVSFGTNDDQRYLVSQFFNTEYNLINPFLEFTKHGLLVSESYEIKNIDFSWIASIGKPAITLEEIFHDQNTNINLAFVLDAKNLLPKIQVGWLNEKDRLLGMNSSGALNFSKNNSTYYLGLQDEFNFYNLKLYYSAFKGMLDDQSYKNSLIKTSKDIKTSSLQAGVIFNNIFSSIDMHLEYEKSLHVTSGQLNLNLPVYRDRYFNLYTEDVSVSLSNNKPEENIRLRFSHEMKNINLYVNFEKIMNPLYGAILSDYSKFSIGYKVLL